MLSYDYKVYVNFSCSNSRFSFTGRIGDRLPDKLVINLPSSLTVKAVYERMVEEMMGSSMLSSFVSQPQFYNLWKEYYPHVSIPMVSSYNM